MIINNKKNIINNINSLIFDVDGVLTNNELIIFPDNNLIRKMSAKDGLALKIAKKQKYNLCIITSGENSTILNRLKNLGIKEIFSNVKDKKEIFKLYKQKKKILNKNVLYMGDDLPDINIMKYIGYPCCPKDAVREVKDISKYISPFKGGKGCVRDVIEQVLKLQNKWIF